MSSSLLAAVRRSRSRSRSRSEEQEQEQEEEEEEEEDEDGESSTDDAAGAPLATGSKRARSFDEGLATHSDPNVRARFADFRAAQAQKEEAQTAEDERGSSLQEALDTFESTKSLAAKKRAIDAILEELAPTTTGVAGHSRTNPEEVNGVAGFLRWFKEEREDLLTHYTIFAGKRNEFAEKKIWGPHGATYRLMDLDMVPDDPAWLIHHRIEFKENDADKAFGQCWNYANWGLPTGTVALEDKYTEWGPSDADTVMHVHGYFLQEVDLDIKDKFRRGHFGVLWPGQEDTLQFGRILPNPNDDPLLSSDDD